MKNYCIDVRDVEMKNMFESYKYWIVFYTGTLSNLVSEHYVGFETIPSQIVIDSILIELHTEPEHDMMETIGNCKYIIVPSNDMAGIYFSDN